MEKQVSLRVSVQSSEGAAPVTSPKETFQWPTAGSASRLRSRSLSRGLSRSASMAPEPEVKGQCSRASARAQIAWMGYINFMKPEEVSHRASQKGFGALILFRVTPIEAVRRLHLQQRRPRKSPTQA